VNNMGERCVVNENGTVMLTLSDREWARRLFHVETRQLWRFWSRVEIYLDAVKTTSDVKPFSPAKDLNHVRGVDRPVFYL